MKASLRRVQLALLLACPALAVALSARPWSQQTFALTAGVWVLVLAGAFLHRAPLPASRGPRTAVLGLVALTALTGASLSWTGVAEPAGDATALAVLYSGLLLAAIPALRSRPAARLVEPTIWLVSLVAALWGLSERFLPGIFTLGHARIEFGRLTQPLGYWNAMGILSGLGLILAASLTADRERPRALRIGAAAAMPILSAGLWLSFSRGALAATLAGLVSIVAVGRTRGRAAASLAALASIAIAAVTIEPLAAVRNLSLPLSEREQDALLFGPLTAAAIIAFGVGAFAALRAARERGGNERGLAPRTSRIAAIVALALAVAPFILVLSDQRQSVPPQAPSGAQLARLASAESYRSEYWRVALGQFRAHPAVGEGAGSFGAAWARHRSTAAMSTGLPPARNAHSLIVETMAELGLVGIVALLALVGGIASCCRRALHLDRRLAVGPTSALIAILSHAAIDWDWQVPGVALCALLLSAAVVGSSDRRPGQLGRAPRFMLAGLATAVIALVAWESYALALQHRADRVIAASKLLGWDDRRWTRVRDLLKRASLLSPNPDPEAFIAIAAAESGRRAEALDAARSLVESNPDSWVAWRLLSEIAGPTDPVLAGRARIRSSELRTQQPDR